MSSIGFQVFRQSLEIFIHSVELTESERTWEYIRCIAVPKTPQARLSWLEPRQSRHSHFLQDWVNVCRDLCLGKVLERIHEVAFRKSVFPLARPLSRLLWFACRVTCVWCTSFQTEWVIRHLTSVTSLKHSQLNYILPQRGPGKDKLKNKCKEFYFDSPGLNSLKNRRRSQRFRLGKNYFLSDKCWDLWRFYLERKRHILEQLNHPQKLNIDGLKEQD